jgi:hypothetical protein
MPHFSWRGVPRHQTAAAGEPSPGADVARAEPSPGADVAGARPVPAAESGRILTTRSVVRPTSANMPCEGAGGGVGLSSASTCVALHAKLARVLPCRIAPNVIVRCALTDHECTSRKQNCADAQTNKIFRKQTKHCTRKQNCAHLPCHHRPPSRARTRGFERRWMQARPTPEADAHQCRRCCRYTIQLDALRA